MQPSRKNMLTLACGLVALTLGSQALAQVTFYEGEDFRGRSFASSSWVSDFTRYGFNDRASSVIVSGGRWELCEDVRFEGRCVVLRPGNYDSLRAMGMNDRVSSVRPAGSPPPPPAPEPVYEYQRRPSERLREVPISSARAVMGAPEQRCWVDREQVPAAQRQPNAGGAVLGAVIGGILGHQVGGGAGKDLATVGGAVAGGVIGSRVGNNGTTETRDVQRCETVANQKPAYWDVTYIFRGQPHHVQMSNEPGRTILVNGYGEPRQ